MISDSPGALDPQRAVPELFSDFPQVVGSGHSSGALAQILKNTLERANDLLEFIAAILGVILGRRGSFA